MSGALHKAKKKTKAGAEKTEVEAKRVGGELWKAGIKAGEEVRQACKKRADEVKKVGQKQKKSFGPRDPNTEFPFFATLIIESNCLLCSLN